MRGVVENAPSRQGASCIWGKRVPPAGRHRPGALDQPGKEADPASTRNCPALIDSDDPPSQQTALLATISSVKGGVVVALMAGLLTVSCTGAEPKPEPQVRALEPVEKIATTIQPEECAIYGACVVSFPSEESEALIAEVRRDKPNWLRYVRAIEFWTGDYGTGGKGPSQAMVETGIFLNETGREMGRTICESMLERKADRVLVWGVVGSPSWMTTSETVRKSLAKCRAGR
jgi:hypothetical protein